MTNDTLKDGRKSPIKVKPNKEVFKGAYLDTKVSKPTKILYDSLYNIGFYVLRIKNGYGQVRLEKMKAGVELHIRYFQDNHLDGADFIRTVEKNCKQNFRRETNAFTYGEKLYMERMQYPKNGLTPKECKYLFNETYESWAAFFCSSLKSVLKFTDADISLFLQNCREIMKDFCRGDKYLQADDIDTGIARTLYEETHFRMQGSVYEKEMKK